MQFLNSELQIKGGIEDNSKINFLISQQNICCNPSYVSVLFKSSYGGLSESNSLRVKL